MRRIAWLLAVCGAVGTAAPWTLADDSSGVARTVDPATRRAVTAAGTQSRPNYYSDLFGESEPVSDGQVVPTRRTRAGRALPSASPLSETVSADRLRSPLDDIRPADRDPASVDLRDTSAGTATVRRESLGRASLNAQAAPDTNSPATRSLGDQPDMRTARPFPGSIEQVSATQPAVGDDAFHTSNEVGSVRMDDASRGASTGVVQAQFEQPTGRTSQNNIQQIRDTRTESDLFPNSGNTVSAPPARRPLNVEEDLFFSADRDTANSFDNGRLGDSLLDDSLLTDPISTSANQPAFDPVEDQNLPTFDLEEGQSRTSSARGNLTFGNHNTGNSVAAPGSGSRDPFQTQERRNLRPEVPITPVPANALPNRGNINFSTGSRISRLPQAQSASGFGNGNTQATVVNEGPVGPINPTVSVEWVKNGNINVGQECVCDLIVRNTGLISAEEIEVAAYFPQNVRLVSSEPEPDTIKDYLGWDFLKLQPGEERTIKITMVPLEAGNVSSQAEVRFTGIASTNFVVSEPKIHLEIEGPQEVLIGEPASHTLTVSNPGTGVASNVQIEAIIPRGLEHARGDRLVMELGSLNPGEVGSMRLALAAVAGGNHVVQIQARGDAGLVQSTAAEINVIAPSLTAEIDGPSLRYLGRNGTYHVIVRNDGAIATDNVRLMHKLPDGFEFVKSDRGTQYDKSNRLVNWFVGRLNPGQTAELAVTLKCNKIGSFTHFARVSSEHGAISDTQFVTQVEGTPSLVMKVNDLDDPVEVGVETAYEIKVTNDGSAPARNVAVACEIPRGMTFLKAGGPVDAFNDHDRVIFRPVAELAPGNTITYRVFVRGIEAGSQRFRAQLASDSISDPLTADEQTRFYGEQ